MKRMIIRPAMQRIAPNSIHERMVFTLLFLMGLPPDFSFAISIGDKHIHIVNRLKTVVNVLYP